MLCTTEYRLVSFADCFAFDNIFSARSFSYIEKSNGETTEACGIITFTLVLEECLPFKTTF